MTMVISTLQIKNYKIKTIIINREQPLSAALLYAVIGDRLEGQAAAGFPC